MSYDPARYRRIPRFCRHYGVSRSGIYRLLASGAIRAVKLNNATLIDCVSADTYLASLPVAEIRNAATETPAAQVAQADVRLRHRA